MTSALIRAVLAGTIVPFARGEGSAIAKAPRQGPVRIGWLGLEGDEQADRVHHGGRDKALHHYPFDHYARWRQDAPDHLLLGAPGAFGENLSTEGLTEDQVCIGDRFRCGSALLEISQPRQPCWKQGHRMEWTTLPKLMVREGRSGWYFRVVEEGKVQAGNAMVLLERPLPDWTVKRVFDLLIGGGWKSEPEALPALRDMALLEKGWRDGAASLIAG
jgi:MOSC domain-containing protein YiiM